jgi:hypothetical protein
VHCPNDRIGDPMLFQPEADLIHNLFAFQTFKEHQITRLLGAR